MTLTVSATGVPFVKPVPDAFGRQERKISLAAILSQQEKIFVRFAARFTFQVVAPHLILPSGVSSLVDPGRSHFQSPSSKHWDSLSQLVSKR